MARFGIALLILVTLPCSTAAAVEEIALDHQSEVRIDGVITGRVENAGDFDDDGIDDLLVLGSDRAYIVYGAPGFDYLNLSDTSARVSKIASDGVLDAAALGDVNGDGVSDVAVLSSESAWVILGGHGRADVQTPVVPSRGYRLTRVAPGQDGYSNGYDSEGVPSIVGVGDLNGDDLADIAIGEPSADEPEVDAGRVTIVFGSTSSSPVDLGSPGARGFRIIGADEYDGTGTAIAGPGDVNGDGRMDLVVSAVGTGPDVFQGSVYALTLDATGADIDFSDGFSGFRIVGNGDSGPEALGAFVAGAGDVDHDGLSDLLLPTPHSIVNGALIVLGSSSEKTVTVTFGPDPGPRQVLLTAPPWSPQHYFGTVVAGGVSDDWNGDGRSDLVLAFNGGAYVLGGPYPQRSFVADDAGPIVTAAFRPGPSLDPRSISRVVDGDFDGDDKLDLALSAPIVGFDGEPVGGAIYVVSGRGPRPGPGVCVERQDGSTGADVLKGTNAGDLLNTREGPDEVRGLDGADCLAAGDDDDILRGEPGFDFLFGGAGNDLLDGGAGGDYLSGDVGDDTVYGGSGNDMLDPGSGADSVDGGPGDDLLDARDGESDQVHCGPAGPLGGEDFAYTDPADTVLGFCGPYGPHIQLSERSFWWSPYYPYPLSTGMAYDRSRDRFLVAWPEFTPHEFTSYAPVGEGRIVARAVDGRGFALGRAQRVSAEIPVITDQDPALMENVAVAALPRGNGFVVSWNEPQPDGSARVASRVVRPNGAPYPAPKALYGHTGLRGTTIDVVAAQRGNHLLAMWDTPTGRGVHIRRLRADGSIAGPARRLRAANSGPPALAAGGRGFLLVWAGGETGAAFARRLDARGRPAGPIRRLGEGRRCCTEGSGATVVYDPDRHRYLAAWGARNDLATVLVRRGGRPIGRPRLYTPGVHLEISEPQIAYGGGHFLLAMHELETSGDRYYPDPHNRTHAYWLNSRGRRAKDRPPYAGPDFSMAHSVGFSEREGRFVIASLATADTVEVENAAFEPLRIFARTWPGAPPD